MFKIKTKSIILLSGFLLINPQFSNASLEDLDYEVVLGTATTNLNFFSAQISDNSYFDFNGSVGVFVDLHFEPTLGFAVTHLNHNFDVPYSKTNFGIYPGLAYNFSTDFRESWVLQLSASIGLSTVEDGMDSGSPGPFRSAPSNQEVRGIFTVGRRVQLSKRFSWYPKAYAIFTPEDKTYETSSSLVLGVIPLSLSIFL